jgi:nitronate monooxygenase
MSRKSLKTRLTEFFDIEHPILSAPMALISGGRLAAAVTSAGGLGLIGGGYGDSDWLRREFGLAEGRLAEGGRSDAALSPGVWPASPTCSMRRWSGDRRPSCCRSVI